MNGKFLKKGAKKYAGNDGVEFAGAPGRVA